MRSVATATAAEAAASAAGAAAGAVHPRPGLIDGDGAGAHVRSVQRLDGIVSLAIVGHFDESEASWLARVPVADQGHFVHLPERFERYPQLILVDSVVEVAHIDVLHGTVLFELC